LHALVLQYLFFWKIFRCCLPLSLDWLPFLAADLSMKTESNEKGSRGIALRTCIDISKLIFLR
jgi:hypothetical protein